VVFLTILIHLGKDMIRVPVSVTLLKMMLGLANKLKHNRTDQVKMLVGQRDNVESKGLRLAVRQH
jgi:hypothetical protein